MRHAVGAPRILAPTERVPVGAVEQLLPGLGVAVGEQVAGLLPTQQRVRRDSPRGALEVASPFEEVEEQRRVVESPLLAPALVERLLEQLAGLRDAEEVLLVGRLLIGVARRDL